MPQVIVSLKRDEVVAELIPYLELLAPAGSVVVFLVPVATNHYPWWAEMLTTCGSDRKCYVTNHFLMPHLTQKQQLRAASDRIAAVRRLLEARGVTVQLHCFPGRAAKELARQREAAAEVIVLQGKNRRPLDKSLACFSFLRRRFATRPATVTLSVSRQ
jgi:hypothetical protein